MGKLKAWLRGANGWKRLWFALSVLGLFYSVLINPFAHYTPADHIRGGYQIGYEYWLAIFAMSGAGALITIVLSALVYFLGVVVAWVTAGFSKK